jgi:hypothetical protein
VTRERVVAFSPTEVQGAKLIIVIPRFESSLGLSNSPQCSVASQPTYDYNPAISISVAAYMNGAAPLPSLRDNLTPT